MWEWKNEQQEAFETLIKVLTETLISACPDFNLPFVLQTDASQDGIGAALIHNQEGNDRVFAYASRTLANPEKNYSVTEKECLAIVWGIKKMRPYLEEYHFFV